MRRPTARARLSRGVSSSSAPRRSDSGRRSPTTFRIIRSSIVASAAPRSWIPPTLPTALIFPHEPKQIFLRAGGNDIHAGRLPREVAADFVEFVRVVHRRLPRTEILFIGLSPAPARWGEADKNRELNRLVRSIALEMPRVGFVNADDISLTPDGRARPELFVKDRLHFAAGGLQAARGTRPSFPCAIGLPGGSRRGTSGSFGLFVAITSTLKRPKTRPEPSTYDFGNGHEQRE